MTLNERPAIAALASLAILQVVMLTALYTKTFPHPPSTTPLFGIAPFLAVSLSAAISAIVLRPLHTTAGKLVALIATALALISFGPQKYFDPQFGMIWPAVICGQFAALTVIAGVIRSGWLASNE